MARCRDQARICLKNIHLRTDRWPFPKHLWKTWMHHFKLCKVRNWKFEMPGLASLLGFRTFEDQLNLVYTAQSRLYSQRHPGLLRFLDHLVSLEHFFWMSNVFVQKLWYDYGMIMLTSPHAWYPSSVYSPRHQNLCQIVRPSKLHTPGGFAVGQMQIVSHWSNLLKNTQKFIGKIIKTQHLDLQVLCEIRSNWVSSVQHTISKPRREARSGTPIQQPPIWSGLPSRHPSETLQMTLPGKVNGETIGAVEDERRWWWIWPHPKVAVTPKKLCHHCGPVEWRPAQDQALSKSRETISKLLSTFSTTEL